MLTQAKIKSILHYNPDTGIFTRLHNSYRSNNAGKEVGYIGKKGYIRLDITIDGIKHKLLAHRIAWLYMTGEIPSECIDHIDENKTNNSFKNLRQATNAQNHQNRSNITSRSSTGFVGVSYFKRDGNYSAQIVVNGKNKHIGYFDTAEEASKAYLSVKEKYHPFSNPNAR